MPLVGLTDLFHTISLNANGLADPMKLAAIRIMVNSAEPHAFVIGETKNCEPVSQRLELGEYDLHENPGWPLGTRGKGKRGVIVGDYSMSSLYPCLIYCEEGWSP
jgi:hypothetical protein